MPLKISQYYCSFNCLERFSSKDLENEQVLNTWWCLLMYLLFNNLGKKNWYNGIGVVPLFMLLTYVMSSHPPPSLLLFLVTGKLVLSSNSFVYLLAFYHMQLWFSDERKEKNTNNNKKSAQVITII